MEILIKRLNERAKLPVYDSEAGPGIDLFILEEVTIEPAAKVIVSTGVALAMPVGYVGLIWNHESMVINQGVKVTSGMVDSGYRKEVIVELENTTSETVVFSGGDKVAQLLIQKIHHASLIEAEELGGLETTEG